MAWKVAESLDQLLGQLNALAPRRSKRSDGSIGDAAHASRSSDHNPHLIIAGQSYVTARDYTHDPAGGLDCQLLADSLQRARDRRVKYVIWNRRIMSGAGGQQPWTWRSYSGSNPHTAHLHLSVVADLRATLRIPWVLPALTTATTAPPEEDDLTPDQDKMLRAVFTQLAGAGAAPGKFTGWPTWGGGTGETLTMVDLARRSNVETRVLRNEHNAAMAAVRAEVSALSKQVGELVAAVRAGGGGGVPPTEFAITGTATAKPVQ